MGKTKKAKTYADPDGIFGQVSKAALWDAFIETALRLDGCERFANPTAKDIDFAIRDILDEVLCHRGDAALRGPKKKPLPVVKYCPYQQDVNGRDVACNCDAAARRACAEEI